MNEVNIFGKSLKEYIAMVWVFFILAAIIMAIVTALRLNNAATPGIQKLATLLGLAVIVCAGVSAVKDHRFNLLQTAFVGFLLSLTAAWALPLFHPPIEALYLLLINGVIYALVAVASGWVAKKILNPKS